MPFRPPPNIVEKALRFKAISHKDGKFYLWGIPCFISQSYAFLYLQRMLEKEYGAKEAGRIIYSMGYLQSENGIKMVNKRFGYAKSIQDKKKLIDFNTGQTDLVGLGDYHWTTDFDKELFIMRGTSPLAEEYKRFFGIQKNPIDYFMRGEAAALITLAIGKDCFTVEKKCISMGNPKCLFMVRPLDRWDKNDKDFKNQYFEKGPSIKDLGGKIQPYLAFK